MNMKKTKLLISLFILTILLSGVANAEISTTSTKIDVLKQKVEEARQTILNEKARIKAEVASTTNNIKNIREELKNAVEIRIGKKLDEKKLQVANVFEKTIENLKSLITRVESRILKMEGNNLDISASKTLLETSKTKLALAETELANLENILSQNIPSVSTSTIKNSERKAILQNIKNQSEKTKTAIKTAHKSIVDVVESLKAGLLKEKKSTTTPVSASSTNN